MARILVIEDEKSIRNLLRLILERAGYEVMLAENGSQGMRMFQSAPADLIITDIVMPEKEGLETIQELRRKFPHVKIFAMSGAEQVLHLNVLDIAEKFGALRTFRKPFTIHEILNAVREVLPLEPRPLA